MLRLCGAAAPSAEEQSFGMRTVAAAVGALQIEISNVHVRYEDETSDPSSPFAFGLTLDRLSSLSLSLSLARARSLCRTLSLPLSLTLSLSPPPSFSLAASPSPSTGCRCIRSTASGARCPHRRWS